MRNNRDLGTIKAFEDITKAFEDKRLVGIDFSQPDVINNIEKVVALSDLSTRDLLRVYLLTERKYNLMDFMITKEMENA